MSTHHKETGSTMTTTSTDPARHSASPIATEVALRLQWLFRHALRQGQVHPLLPLLMQYRGVA